MFGKLNLREENSKRKVYFLLIVLFVILCIYGYFFSFLDGSYSPYYGDEFFYYKNAEAFANTGSLSAAFTYSGLGSIIGHFDAHGPVYPFIYGISGIVLGWSSLAIPILNICFLLFAIFLLASQDATSLIPKALQILLILGSPITLFYTFSFMPTLLQISGGIFLFLGFKKYENEASRHHLLLLLLLILGLGLMRSTWFFALLGFAALPNSFDWKKYVLALISVVGLSFFYQSFFHESLPNVLSQALTLTSQQEYGQAFETIFFNLKRNLYFGFTYSEGYFYTLQKVWILTSFISALVFFRKVKLVQVTILIFGLLLLSNLLFYKNYNWTDLRMYTPMTVLLLLSIIDSGKKPMLTLSLISIGLISFILVLPQMKQITQLRQDYQAKKIPIAIIDQIERLESPLIVVDSIPLLEFDLLQLPVKNESGKLIRYILPYYELGKFGHPSHQLVVKNNQLTVSPVNILNQ